MHHAIEAQTSQGAERDHGPGAAGRLLSDMALTRRWAVAVLRCMGAMNRRICVVIVS